MQERYALCSIIIVITYLVFQIAGYLTPPLRPRAEWFIPPTNASAETLLAMGEKIPFGCADMSDLLLIPGVSDKSASTLLAQRDRIIAAAAGIPGHGSPFTLAHGIGEKRAALLARFLTFETRSISEQCRAHALLGTDDTR